MPVLESIQSQEILALNGVPPELSFEVRRQVSLVLKTCTRVVFLFSQCSLSLLSWGSSSSPWEVATTSPPSRRIAHTLNVGGPGRFTKLHETPRGPLGGRAARALQGPSACTTPTPGGLGAPAGPLRLAVPLGTGRAAPPRQAARWSDVYARPVHRDLRHCSRPRALSEYPVASCLRPRRSRRAETPRDDCAVGAPC